MALQGDGQLWDVPLADVSSAGRRVERWGSVNAWAVATVALGTSAMKLRDVEVKVLAHLALLLLKKIESGPPGKPRTRRLPETLIGDHDHHIKLTGLSRVWPPSETVMASTSMSLGLEFFHGGGRRSHSGDLFAGKHGGSRFVSDSDLLSSSYAHGLILTRRGRLFPARKSCPDKGRCRLCRHFVQKFLSGRVCIPLPHS